jgi:hypothetical protein
MPVRRLSLRGFSLLLVGVATVLTAGCHDVLTSPEAAAEQSATARGVAEHVPTYAEERPGTFADMADSALWKHIEYSQGVAVVGLRKPGANRGVYHGRILIDQDQWRNASAAIAAQHGVRLIWADTLLPTIKVHLDDYDSFLRVRHLPEADYVEPIRAVGDIPSLGEGSLSCSSSSSEWADTLLYTNGTYGDAYSVKHRTMGIENAWRRTGGAGVTVGVIDTGLHGGQLQLLAASRGGRFQSGESGGRWVRYRNAWTSGADVEPVDHCGHGTKTAGVIAAPRDGVGPVGVAWKSNLVSTRIADDVIAVNADDAQHGIRETLGVMDSLAGGKVISMSWQSFNWWWQVSNEIEYWQNRHPNDLLFFAAAGTTPEDWIECSIGGGLGAGLDWILARWNPYVGAFIFLGGAVVGCILPSNGTVVFPANHANVHAVTCVDYDSGDVSNNCHYGDKVEFSAYQRLPTVWGNSSVVDQLKGSSGTTPAAAGEAALIWSKYPYMSGSQVIERMHWAGRPTRDSKQGYGVINAYKAVGGMYDGRITSTEPIYTTTWPVEDSYILSAQHSGGDGPFLYQWSTGETTQSITAPLQLNPDFAGSGSIYGMLNVSVTITDLSDGGTMKVVFHHNFIQPADESGSCPTCIAPPP